jgi:hypothetical protein
LCFPVLEFTRSTFYDQAMALEASIASQSRQADNLWHNVKALDAILQLRTEEGKAGVFTAMLEV